MSRADSHDVGGDGGEAVGSVFGGGEEGIESHEKAGGDSVLRLSLSDIGDRCKGLRGRSCQSYCLRHPRPAG